MQVKKIYMLLLFVAFLVANLLAKSLATSGNSVNAVLQYHIDLSNPPTVISAISIIDQVLQSGVSLSKGTKFIGKLEKIEGSQLVIAFHTIQRPSGVQEPFNGKTILGDNTSSTSGSVSSKVGETINSNTKSTVLGAIFGHNGADKRPIGNVLPRGANLKIEIN